MTQLQHSRKQFNTCPKAKWNMIHRRNRESFARKWTNNDSNKMICQLNLNFSSKRANWHRFGATKIFKFWLHRHHCRQWCKCRAEEVHTSVVPFLTYLLFCPSPPCRLLTDNVLPVVKRSFTHKKNQSRYIKGRHFCWRPGHIAIVNSFRVFRLEAYLILEPRVLFQFEMVRKYDGNWTKLHFPEVFKIEICSFCIPDQPEHYHNCYHAWSICDIFLLQNF